MRARQNPTGRLDVAILAAAEKVTRTRLEPRAGFPLWDFIAPLAQAAVKRMGVPRKNLLSSGLGKAVQDAIGGRL